jgi:O-antigen chain-terminating methyltransferase
VDTEPDFVEQCVHKGLDVRQEDGVLHVESLSSGAIDGIVASHVAEHLDPARLTRLIDGAFSALPPGGVLILETPNPESLVAGSINFHRDPTHLRPIHPDTLAFLCESAGFDPVEIRRMSPVPQSERLPRAPETSPGAEHINALADRLNDLLYGFQDYAVVATRAT